MTQRRSGYSLIEMLVVMSGLGIALGFGGLLLVSAMRADQVSSQMVARMRRQIELSTFFRADVANAIEAPSSVGDFKAGPACIILRQPGFHLVVYRWSEGRLEQITKSLDTNTIRPIAMPTGNCAVDFAVSGSVITLNLRETSGAGAVTTFPIVATLGGDRR